MPEFDELYNRIRSLEAERLRPVPAPPRHNGGLITPDLPAITEALYGPEQPRQDRRRRADPDAAIRALRAAGNAYRARTTTAPSEDPEPPGPRDSTPPTAPGGDR